jgi:hypothetical protein
MRLFEPVWKMYLKGELKEQQAEQRESIALPTQRWEKFTCALDTIALYSPANLHSFVNEEFEKTLEELEQVEHAGKIVLEEVVADDIVYGHLLRVAKTSEQVNNHIKEEFSKIYKRLTKHTKKFHNELTLGEQNDYYKTLQTVLIDVKTTMTYIDRRNILIKQSTRKTVEKYDKQVQSIQEIKEQIIDLKTRYIALDLDGEGIRDLEKIMRRIQKSFDTGELYKACQKVHYRQGELELETLYNQASELREQAEYYKKRKEQLQDAINHLETITPKHSQEKIKTTLIQYNLKIKNDLQTIYLGSLAKIYHERYERVKEYVKEIPETTQPKIIRMKPNTKPPQVFSLPAYLSEIGEPKDESLLALYDCLLETTTSWTKRFDTYTSLLTHTPLNSRKKRTYLNRVAQGLAHAIEHPSKDFDTKHAQQAYNATTELLHLYAA